VGFEPTTPGSKVPRSVAERPTTTADSNSAVLTAWTDRFCLESGAQVSGSGKTKPPRRAEFVSAPGLWRAGWDSNPRLPD
jgi:hypothetical protein